MGIPFLTMDAHNIVNNMVNDAVGIIPSAPEPSGPIDITDQVTIDGIGSWGNGGYIALTLPDNYVNYHCEIITEWTENSTIFDVAGFGLNDRNDVVDGNIITTTGVLILTGTVVQAFIQINSGSGITTNPRLISVKVSETAF